MTTTRDKLRAIAFAIFDAFNLRKPGAVVGAYIPAAWLVFVALSFTFGWYRGADATTTHERLIGLTDPVLEYSSRELVVLAYRMGVKDAERKARAQVGADHHDIANAIRLLADDAPNIEPRRGQP